MLCACWVFAYNEALQNIKRVIFLSLNIIFIKYLNIFTPYLQQKLSKIVYSELIWPLTYITENNHVAYSLYYHSYKAYCAFDIFQKVMFYLVLYTEVKLQTFVVVLCKTICRNNLCTKKFYSSHWLLKYQIFSLFPIVKLNADYTEICRVGNLEADFQQVPFVKIFWKFHNIVEKNQ